MVAVSDTTLTVPRALKYTGIYQMLPEPVKQYLEKCNRSQKGKVLRVISSLAQTNGFEQALASKVK